MLNTADIRIALEQRLNEMYDLPPVVFENIEYTPEQGEVHIITKFQPVFEGQATMGTEARQRKFGNYIVTVMVPVGTGPDTGSDWADQIAEHFRPQPTQVYSYNNTHVRIQRVSVNPVVIDGAWAAYPVTIRYFTYS